MKSIHINTTLIEGYLRLLENLSPALKLDLISKLTATSRTGTDRKNSMDKAFGAWESEQSADELIADLRSHRTFNRRIEEL